MYIMQNYTIILPIVGLFIYWFIKKYITSLQLCQLIPQPICLYLYNTDDNYNILLFFTFYSVGLVMLFGRFYYDNYMKIKST
jgi:hypothetical protein